jgi:hypothetical protein
MPSTPLKPLFTLLLVIFFVAISAQKHLYDVQLLGKSIGSMQIERVDKGNGEIEIKLKSTSEVNIFFTKKSSDLTYDVVYKNGKLLSSYCKNVKDDVTEVVTVVWDGMKYMIKKGAEALEYERPIDFSALLLYYNEPIGRTRIFSERIGQFCTFVKLAEGVYQCKMENGVSNTYHYKNGVMTELEMSKGASVFLKLIK